MEERNILPCVSSPLWVLLDPLYNNTLFHGWKGIAERKRMTNILCFQRENFMLLRHTQNYTYIFTFAPCKETKRRICNKQSKNDGIS